MKRPAGPDAPRPSDDESIAATAAAWLAQRDDSFSAAEAAAFDRWRAADPRHEAAVVRLEATWSALAALRDFRPAAQRHPDRDLLAAPTGRRGTAPLRTAALALAAALAIAIGGWAFLPPSQPGVSYTTTSGGYERVILDDGSVLELNGGTEAEVVFSPEERRVRLNRGEAHFTVAKNPDRPFRVEASGIAVRAVGTAFNVRLGAREVEVLVTEGKVTVSEPPRLLPAVVQPPESDAARPQSHPTSADTLLVANERARISLPEYAARVAPSGPPVIEHLAPSVVGELLAWQGPRLVFVDTPLAEVVAQFNRRNPVKLILADPALAKLPVGGSFRAENVEAFVRLLESGGDVAVERPDPFRVVLQRVK